MAKVKAKDTISKYERILSDLKKMIYKPVYLLMGEEPYYIDQISQYVADNVLDESEKAFNQVIMYGKDVDARTIVFSAARPPMMSNNQVVIVREAQQVKKMDDLESYLKSPLPSTILVLCYKGKTMDKRTKVYKEIEKHGEILESVKLYENEIPAWVNEYLKMKGYAIEPRAAMVLAEFLGTDLSRIASELDKLFILLPQGKNQITADHIEQNVGISKEYNTFELNAAIVKRDVLKANRIVNYFAANPSNHPLVVTISALYFQFNRLFKLQMVKRMGRTHSPGEMAGLTGIEPYFMREYEDAARNYPVGKVVQIFSLLREYDMRGKGWFNSNTTHGELLKELVFKIMH